MCLGTSKLKPITMRLRMQDTKKESKSKNTKLRQIILIEEAQLTKQWDKVATAAMEET